MRNPAASPRYVLGVNPGFHDGAAALLRDGELVAMVEQERLSRIRRAPGEPPREAIAACLAHAGIGLDAVAEIALGWDFPLWLTIEDFDPTEGKGLAHWLFGELEGRNDLLPPLRYVEHHIAHAASGFYTSGMREAAILVVDGRGESVATSIAVGGPGGIETVKAWGLDISLGHLYGIASKWVGLGVWGAGKLMGLAAYGKPCQPVPLRASTDGFAIDGAPTDLPISEQMPQLAENLVKGFRQRNYPFCPGSPGDVMAHANFAASIQRALEDVLLNLARIARVETGHSDLVMVGGVASNCSANGALIRSGAFDEVWIPPFAYDAGVSLGAALVADRAIGNWPAGPRPRLAHALWSPETGGPDGDDLTALSACETSRHDDADLADVVANHLASGKLVGWWQGRAEVGQRALGARSILCDPRKRQALLRANLVKGRESWRPLAPAVLSDHADTVFDGPLPAAADFMLAAWPVREQAQPRIPAAVHVDGSARPQVVHPTRSRYHDLIEAFHDRSGVPAVINTSFNLAGEPMVLTAGDAVSTFLRSDLDVLVLDDLVAVKP